MASFPRGPLLGVCTALTACSSARALAPPDATSGDGPPIAPVVDAAPEAGFNVLTLNLHCLNTEGTAFGTNTARFAAVAAAVAAERVDVVLAQEVCVNATEDARAMLRSALATATGRTWNSVDAFAHRAWVGTIDEADEYVAIFAPTTLSAPHATDHRVQGSLRRITLGATLAPRDGQAPTVPFRVYTVHLDHMTAATRAAQAREVATTTMVEGDAEVTIGLAGGSALPVIVGGDFNARANEDPPQALRQFGFINASANAGIDHVLVHRSAPIVARSTAELFVDGSAVSDHPGVLVRFAATAPTAVKLTRITTASTQPQLAVRGDRAPLSWTAGWPMIPRAGTTGATLITSELAAGGFAYKFLRRDTDWALGDNATGLGESDNTSTPAFP
jgi:endonuclease/exonuclease/phosphatase family metal-dependent hydrolase